MYQYRYTGHAAEADIVLRPTGRVVTVAVGDTFGATADEAEALDAHPETYARVTGKAGENAGGKAGNPDQKAA